MNDLMSPKILYLSTSARGGSKLFHSLLENHPEIVCLPRTFRMTIFLELINHQLENCDYISKTFINFYPRFFNGVIWSKFNSLDKSLKVLLILSQNNNGSICCFSAAL